jgi:DNA-binding beta-propeller fold protein YncE
MVAGLLAAAGASSVSAQIPLPRPTVHSRAALGAKLQPDGAAGPTATMHDTGPALVAASGPATVYSGNPYHFSNPSSIAFDGTHVWVANWGGNSVTELDASNGAWDQTLSAGSYGFDGLRTIAFGGTHVWVTNVHQGIGPYSITELDTSNGAWARTYSGAHYHFDYPEAMAFDGSHLWVANRDGDSVTEITTQ